MSVRAAAGTVGFLAIAALLVRRHWEVPDRQADDGNRRLDGADISFLQLQRVKDQERVFGFFRSRSSLEHYWSRYPKMARKSSLVAAGEVEGKRVADRVDFRCGGYFGAADKPCPEVDDLNRPAPGTGKRYWKADLTELLPLNREVLRRINRTGTDARDDCGRFALFALGLSHALELGPGIAQVSDYLARSERDDGPFRAAVEPRPGEVHPPPYLSLEYIEGGNLEQHIETPQSPLFAARTSYPARSRVSSRT